MPRHEVTHFYIRPNRACIHFVSPCGIRCLDIHVNGSDPTGIFDVEHKTIYICTVVGDGEHLRGISRAKEAGLPCAICRDLYLDSRELIILDTVVKLNFVLGIKEYLTSLGMEYKQYRYAF